MADSDSDLEQVSSQPVKEVYDTVPEDKKYKFKLFSSSRGSGGLELLEKFAFDLKKGKQLPYITTLKGIYLCAKCSSCSYSYTIGYSFEFSRELLARVEGFETGIIVDNYTTFEEKAIDKIEGTFTFKWGESIFIAAKIAISYFNTMPP